MAMGMSYDEYWYDDVWKAVYYSKAYNKIKQQQDEFAWLQGLYIFDALSKALSNFSDGLAGKNRKPAQYPDKPYGTYDDKDTIKQRTTAEKEQEAEAERLKAKLFFENWARATAKRF